MTGLDQLGDIPYFLSFQFWYFSLFCTCTMNKSRWLFRCVNCWWISFCPVWFEELVYYIFLLLDRPIVLLVKLSYFNFHMTTNLCDALSLRSERAPSVEESNISWTFILLNTKSFPLINFRGMFELPVGDMLVGDSSHKRWETPKRAALSRSGGWFV